VKVPDPPAGVAVNVARPFASIDDTEDANDTVGAVSTVTVTWFEVTVAPAPSLTESSNVHVPTAVKVVVANE
jgi:hypothetical protein